MWLHSVPYMLVIRRLAVGSASAWKVSIREHLIADRAAAIAVDDAPAWTRNELQSSPQRTHEIRLRRPASATRSRLLCPEFGHQRRSILEVPDGCRHRILDGCNAMPCHRQMTLGVCGSKWCCEQAEGELALSISRMGGCARGALVLTHDREGLLAGRIVRQSTFALEAAAGLV